MLQPLPSEEVTHQNPKVARKMYWLVAQQLENAKLQKERRTTKVIVPSTQKK